MEQKNNLFKITFVVSLIFHSLILLPISAIKNAPEVKRPTFLTYLKTKVPVRISKNSALHGRDKPKKILTQKKRISKKYSKRSKIQQKRRKTKRKHIKKTANAARQNAIKKPDNKEIVTKNRNPDKLYAKDKLYIDYYKLINERLRQAIIYPQYFSEGEVLLSFIVTCDGNLISVEVINSDCPDNNNLGTTAVEIIRNASPFPPFPENLRRIQLTFNVVICFREKT